MFGKIIGYLFSAIMASLAIALVAYTGWQVGDRSLPVVILEEPVLLTPVVKAGEEAKVRIKFVVQQYCPTHVDAFLFDANDTLVRQTAHDAESGQAEVGKPEEFILPIPVPIDAPSGRTTFRALTTYRCNWVQRMWPLVAPPFEVSWTTEAVPEGEIQERISDELKDLLLEQGTVQ